MIMGELSHKIARFAILGMAGILILSACLEPVDIDAFYAQDSVDLHPDSEPYLIAGNRIIRGLDPNKYYKIEEINENGISLGVMYVIENGMQSANLGEIRTVYTRSIFTLVNLTYSVTLNLSG